MTEQNGSRWPAYSERLDNHVLQDRHARVGQLRERGVNPFANGFEVHDTAASVFARFGLLDAETLAADETIVRVAGRIRFQRRMGKACFVKIHDRSCRPGVKPQWGDTPPTDDFLQLFVSHGVVGDEAFELINQLDLGDIVGAVGRVMRTKTGELSIAVQRIELLTKSVRPLPDKFHGLADVEQRYRQRYVDLVMNDESREVFLKRVLIVRRIREFFEARGFLEVETPMMHVNAGGAAARPFVTHHNALDMDLFLRIAPELHLKRLLVGGFERVFELNRNFRNEGLSRQHNPEFTMLEFYQAYATYADLMDLTEELIAALALELHGRDEHGRVVVPSEHGPLDLTSPWRRASVAQLAADGLGVAEAQLADRDFLIAQATRLGIQNATSLDNGRLVYGIFEIVGEPGLIQPTFVTDFPASVSPLARRKDNNADLVDRFELFVGGREIANAFSELNDPEDQYGRFVDQLAARDAGDDEAMPMDEDYVRALEYGMPPAAGEGIGIDRLVMLLTNAASIRDVILFPHMRPE
jgi:lysyl-tRNA synthetase class 2